MSSTDRRGGEVITFYSYKGGTGRSMALANVACVLAGREHRVLAIDWDLEAPGLHRFFGGHLSGARALLPDDHLGLIDMFWELEEELHRAGDEQLADRVRPEEYAFSTAVSGLDLLTAGRFNGTYPERVRGFDWRRFFLHAPHLIPSMFQRLAEQYDYILIDSRTGVTDTGGICTMLLPEKLVAVFTPNRQSILGVAEVAGLAIRYRLDSADVRPLSVFPLPSRVEASEAHLRHQWRYGDAPHDIPGYQPMFERLFRESYPNHDSNLDDYFDEVQIPHIPHYAYGEKLAVLEAEHMDRFSLGRSYEQFTHILTSHRAPWRYRR